MHPRIICSYSYITSWKSPIWNNLISLGFIWLNKCVILHRLWLKRKIFSYPKVLKSVFVIVATKPRLENICKWSGIIINMKWILKRFWASRCRVLSQKVLYESVISKMTLRKEFKFSVWQMQVARILYSKIIVSATWFLHMLCCLLQDLD